MSISHREALLIQGVNLSHAACEQVSAAETASTPGGEQMGPASAGAPTVCMADLRQNPTNCSPGMG